MFIVKRGHFALCLFLLTFFALASGFFRLASADNISPWLSSTLYIDKLGDVPASDIPSTFFGEGNTDCTTIYDGRCSIDSPNGSIWNSSVWIDGKWRPVKDYGGNSSNFYAIPNSDTGMTTSLPSGFGSYIYFTDDTSMALVPHYLLGAPDLGARLSYFQLNKLYDRKLADKKGNRLTVDLNSMGFSGNSRWMIATSPNIANLRINIESGEVLPFGKVLTYGLGQNPRPKNAITSDGRYALEATRDASTFTIYDLSTCTSAPDSISQPVGCQGRNLINTGYLSSLIPGYSGTLYARFIDEMTIKFYASYLEGSVTKYAEYVLSTSSGAASQLQYLALGDSYISGEGTFDYIAGTDTAANKCHQSKYSYPSLIGHDLSYDSFNSVACSGATTVDVINSSDSYSGQTTYKLSKAELLNTPHFDNVLSSFSPGWIDQLEFVKKYQPHEITISIGGNDMGFSEIVYRCAAPWYHETCYSTYEDRLELVQMINDSVFPNLVKTYAQLKNAGPPNMRIYVIGYPQIALPGGNCAVNVQLNKDELVFSQQLISYLDEVIKDAADRVGVKYVDTQNALEKHRLCEAGPDSIAINGITAGNDRPSILGGPLGDESYHPNKIGYRLLEEKILAETNNLSAALPLPDPAANPPIISSDLEILSDAPKTGRPINSIQYDYSIAPDFAYRGTPINISINGIGHNIASGTALKAVLHSTPIDLGTYQTSNDRNLAAQVTIPISTESGYHVVHFFGKDIAGQPVDVYKSIYIAATADDIDGNGILDSKQSCIGVPESGQDLDKDGIDDACDAYIGPAPAIKEGGITSSDSSLNKASGTLGDDSNNFNTSSSVVINPQKQIVSGDSVVVPFSNGKKPKVLAAITANPSTEFTGTGSRVELKKSFWVVASGVTFFIALAFVSKRRIF